MECVIATVPLDPGISDAELRLADYFENRRMGNGKIVIPLRVSLDALGFPGKLEITHRATISVKREQSESHPKSFFAIEWQMLDGTLFPALRGKVVVWSRGGSAQSYLELQGAYDPPSGESGPAFDASIGRLIAERAAASFLEDAAAGIRATAAARTSP